MRQPRNVHNEYKYNADTNTMSTFIVGFSDVIDMMMNNTVYPGNFYLNHLSLDIGVPSLFFV